MPHTKSIITFSSFVSLRMTRCRSLALKMPNLGLMRTLVFDLHDFSSAPLLERLTLCQAHWLVLQNPCVQKCVTFYLSVDMRPLTHVNLYCVHIDWARSRFLSGLTTLGLSKHHPDARPRFLEMARMLLESPNLQSLVLMESGPAGGTDEWDAELADTDSLNPAMLWSVSLSEATLIFNEPDYLTDLVTGFVFPNLKTLHLGIKRPEADYTRLLESLVHPAPHAEKSILAGLEELDIV